MTENEIIEIFEGVLDDLYEMNMCSRDLEGNLYDDEVMRCRLIEAYERAIKSLQCDTKYRKKYKRYKRKYIDTVWSIKNIRARLVELFCREDKNKDADYMYAYRKGIEDVLNIMNEELSVEK